MPRGFLASCCRSPLTLLKLAKHIQSTLVTAIVAGLSTACEDSQEMDEQEWDEKAVGGASFLSLYLRVLSKMERGSMNMAVQGASD